MSTRVQVESCPLCNSDRRSHFDFASIEEHGDHLHYRICKRCGLVFQSPRMSEETLDQYYDSEYRESLQGSSGPTEKDLRMQHARATHLLEFSSTWVKSIGKCLDVGSSSGALLETFQAAHGCEGIGIEPGHAYAEYSREGGFRVVADIQDLEKEHENSFDLIAMGHTLEHIPEPAEFLLELRERWLSPNGYLLLEVPNLYGHQSFERAHLFAFSKSTLQELLRRTGFQILDVKVHGYPRSHLIPLYLTILAHGLDRTPVGDVVRSTSSGVRARRKLGMLWHQLASRLLSRWAWLPWPEVERV